MADENSAHSSPSLPLYSTMSQPLPSPSSYPTSASGQGHSFVRPTGGSGGSSGQQESSGQELLLPGGFGGTPKLRYQIANGTGGGVGTQQRHSMHVPPSYNVDMTGMDEAGGVGMDVFGRIPTTAGAGGRGSDQGRGNTVDLGLHDGFGGAGSQIASAGSRMEGEQHRRQQSSFAIPNQSHHQPNQSFSVNRPFGQAPEPPATASIRYSTDESASSSSFANALARSTSLGAPRRKKNDVESGLADMDPSGYDDYPYALGGSESGRMPSSGMLLGGTIRNRGSDASSTEAMHLASGLSGHGQQHSGSSHPVQSSSEHYLPDGDRGRYRQSTMQASGASGSHSAYDPPSIPAPLRSANRAPPPASPNAMSMSVSPSLQATRTATHDASMQEDPWPQYSSRQSQSQAGQVPPLSAPGYRYSPSESSKDASPNEMPIDPMLSIGNAMKGSGSGGHGGYGHTPLSPTQRRDRVSSSARPDLGATTGYGSTAGSSSYGAVYGHSGTRDHHSNLGTPMVLGTSASSGSGSGSGMNLSPMSGHDLPYLQAGATFPNSSSAVRHQGMRSRSSQHLNTARINQGLPFTASTPASLTTQPAQYGDFGMGGASSAQNGTTRQNEHEEDKGQRQGFRQIRDPMKDLTPQTNMQNIGRRADSNNSGNFLSPLQCLTSQLAQTYNICNPSFTYEVAHNPRRVLTKPSKPCHNGGSDNEDYDYILYVNDVLTADNGTGDKYLILDVLGQGTFGQVVKCQNMRTHAIVAVKVVKNKPAYFNQSMMEVAILQLLNTEADKNDEHHILRMLDSFIHHRHLCIVFECLASNLYELIKHNQFRGLSLQLVKMFTAQLLDALTVLKDARLIHCDLKPENILLKSLNSPQIKVIDFGSACHERQTVYTYIQSRFYRSPEVLLGLPYSTAIDMWSLGCIIVELFLGLPLFPGTSEYNQLSRIIDMLGQPPSHLLEMGKQVNEFFNNVGVDQSGRKLYRLKSMDQFASEHNTNEQPSKQYFKATKLPEIVKTYTLPKKVTRQADIDKEMNIRASFIDFVGGLLELDPIKRWSPQQAKLHPFVTGERFVGPFDPTRPAAPQTQPSRSAASSSEGRYRTGSSQQVQAQQAQQKKYGGLVATQTPKGARAYTDAASYNQQVAQHQQYAAAQQQAQAQAAQASRQPFSQAAYDAAAAQYSHSSQSRMSAVHSRTQSHAPPVLRSGQPTQPRIPSYGGSAVPASHSAGTFLTMPSQSHGEGHLAINVGNLPPTSYHPTTRHRANTINQMDVIPPALARLTHLGPADPAGTRSSLTPVLNRDEAIREWERRNIGGGSGHAKRPSMAHGNAQLDFLQEQAELHHSAWANATGYGNGGRHTVNGSAYGMQPPPPVMIDSPGRSNQHRPGVSSEYGFLAPMMGGAASVPTSPRTGGPSSAPHPGHHHAQSTSGNLLPAIPPPAASAFDAYDPRGDGNLSAMMYTPGHGNSLDPTMAYSSGIRHGQQPSTSSHQQMMSSGGYGQGLTPLQSMEQQMAQLPTSPQRYQNVRRRSGQPSQGGNGGFGMYDA